MENPEIHPYIHTQELDRNYRWLFIYEMTYNIQGKLKNASEVYNEILLFYSYHIGKNPEVL